MLQINNTKDFNKFLITEKLNDKFNSFKTLSEHQKEIFIPLVLKLDNIIKASMSWDNIITLSGSAGVGKTFVTSKIIELFTLMKYNITITAPTHKALSVISKTLNELDISKEKINTKTIHSYLNLKQQKDYNTGKTSFVPDKKKEILNTDLLIVDESSMVGESIYEYIIQAIEHDKCKAVLFIGDYYQLPSVEGNTSNVFSINNKYKLKEIVRQAEDSYIIEISTKARDIIKSKKYEDVVEFIQNNSDAKLEIFYNNEDFIEDFTTPEDWYKNDKILTSFKNNDVDYYNKLIRNKYWATQNIYDVDTLRKGDTIIFQSAHVVNEKVIHQNSEIIELSEAIQKTLSIKPNYTLNYWSCKNVRNNEPFNVLDPQSEDLYKMLLNKQASKAKKTKSYEKRKEEWKKFFTFKEFFVDVKYTYSSTIHKLQGSTYDTVYIDLTSLAQSFEYTKDKDLFYRLIYVALTRASKNIKILLPQNNNDMYYEKQKDIISNMNFNF